MEVWVLQTNVMFERWVAPSEADPVELAEVLQTNVISERWVAPSKEDLVELAE